MTRTTAWTQSSRAGLVRVFACVCARAGMGVACGVQHGRMLAIVRCERALTHAGVAEEKDSAIMSETDALCREKESIRSELAVLRGAKSKLPELRAQRADVAKANEAYETTIKQLHEQAVSLAAKRAAAEREVAARAAEAAAAAREAEALAARVAAQVRGARAPMPPPPPDPAACVTCVLLLPLLLLSPLRAGAEARGPASHGRGGRGGGGDDVGHARAVRGRSHGDPQGGGDRVEPDARVGGPGGRTPVL
jgi:hypothetical protein